MGLKDVFDKMIDPYDRSARLWPALLALFPIIVLFVVAYGPKNPVLTGIVTTVTSCGGLYLLARIARNRGKRLEGELYAAWDGKPSTQLLRHRDTNIEAPTKKRYHAFLAEKIAIPFPTAEQESSDSMAADDIYQSGVRWLLNQTRDSKKFSLLFKENISYGFHRNALGIRPIGITISTATLVVSLLWGLGLIAFAESPKQALLETPLAVIVLLATSVIMLLVWILYINSENARMAAFSYAETLLRACDELGQSKTPSISKEKLPASKKKKEPKPEGT